MTSSRFVASGLPRLSNRLFYFIVAIGCVGLVLCLAGIYTIAGMPFGWALASSLAGMIMLVICIYLSL